MPSKPTSKNLTLRIILFLTFISLSRLTTYGQDTTLQSMATFPFGASINTTLLRTNATYRALVAREFNSVTAENVMKMGTIHPAINTYNWVMADTLVNFAEQYGKRVHGHTLVWHQSLPGWVNSFVGDSAAWENILKTHIQTVVSHYAGKLASWDVVNEAFNDDGTLRNSVWLQHLGSNYIARCFQYAHDADPNVLLFYNDYGHEYSTAKLNAIAALINTFKANGIPIHGVGLQMHMNKNSNNNSITNAINVMVQTGLKVHISELDISMNPENNQALTYTAAIAQQLADKYRFVTKLYKTIPAAQQFGITTWDVSDADTWITSNYSRPDWPLPFDTMYQKKLAYYAIIDALTSKWKYDAAGAVSVGGTYADLGSDGTPITTNFSGSAMSNDDDNSSVQQIGFNFSYNGSNYNQFVLNTNGFIKLGPVAPSSAAIFYATSSANTNGIITAPDADVLYPYNHDLLGTAGTEYRVYTSGQAGLRVCTIQYKNVADKLAPVQYASMNFQVKLYEAGGVIEFVYGPWTASGNTATLITGAVGIKGSAAVNSVNLGKGSGTAWSSALSTANNMYYVNGDYATAGPQFNTRNNVLPDAGRRFRFVAMSDIVLPVRLSRFSAVNDKTNIILTWLATYELNNRDYEVQRSVNGIDFSSIGTLAARAAGIGQAYDYSFTDAGIAGLPSIVYYRLKQNDKDGKSIYSNILTVRIDERVKSLVVKAQNPFRTTLSLQITSPVKGDVAILISNTNGAVLLKKTVPVQVGANLLTIDEATGFSPGIYILECRAGVEASSLKLMKK